MKDDWSGPPMRCVDCAAPVREDHSEYGFGHYHRCCACYEKRQRGGRKGTTTPQGQPQ